jgi:hypothetical protein
MIEWLCLQVLSSVANHVRLRNNFLNMLIYDFFLKVANTGDKLACFKSFFLI